MDLTELPTREPAAKGHAHHVGGPVVDAFPDPCSTVVRTAKALGYPALRELKRSVVTTLARRRDLAHVVDDRVDRIARVDDALDRVLGDRLDVLDQLREMLDRESWRLAVDLVLAARRVYGIGPAGVVAEMLTTAPGLRDRASRRGGGNADHQPMRDRHRRRPPLGNRLPARRQPPIPRRRRRRLGFAPVRFFKEIEVFLQHARQVSANYIVVTADLSLARAGQADIILSTPQSATTSASENLVGVTLAHAVVFAVAGRTHDRGVQTLEQLNDLRPSGRSPTGRPATPVPDA